VVVFAFLQRFFLGFLGKKSCDGLTSSWLELKDTTFIFIHYCSIGFEEEVYNMASFHHLSSKVCHNFI
jgi:hypothetical protein